MDKLNGMSLDLEKQNIDKIKELFPEAVEEGKINFEMLKVMLGDEVDESKEKYQFTWNGKSKSIKLAQTPSSATLRPCKEKSKNWDTTENIYIEGDNLEVLKQLQKTYYGKIKMIYIDPPYNTGKDFVYNDSFTNSIENYKEQTNQTSSSNPESNGRFHTDWLNMIYPRLILAKSLLSDDGVIAISIDGHELDTLIFLCNEIFSESNSLGMLVLQTATDNNPTQINEEHEYMICYAKNKLCLPPWYRISKAAESIQKQYEKIKKLDSSIDNIQIKLREWINNNKEEVSQVAHYNCVDEKGVYSASSNSSNPHPGGYMYDIVHYKTKLPCPKPANGWRWPEKTFLKLADEGEVHWGVDQTTQPHIKKRLSTAREQLKSIIYEDNRAETKMLSQLFDGKKVFDNPKPHKVLAKIFDFAINKNDIVLDFFSGSATTAHAVMKLNEEDGGNRKFIMVQLPELCTEKSEAYKAGYKNICEIGEERIRRAGEQIKNDWEKEHPSDGLFGSDEKFTTDIGFKVFKLDSTNVNEWDPNMMLDERELAMRLGEVFKEDRTKEDILYEIMLKYGVFDKQVEEINVNGKPMYRVGKRYMIVCLDNQITSEDVKAIGELSPRTVIFSETGFNNDNDKINAVYNLEKCGVEDVKCI